MTNEIAVNEFVVEMGGYVLADQLAIWLQENDWGGYDICISPKPDSDAVELELNLAGTNKADSAAFPVLVYAMTMGLSEDWELVSRKVLTGIDGLTIDAVFTVRSL